VPHPRRPAVSAAAAVAVVCWFCGSECDACHAMAVPVVLPRLQRIIALARLTAERTRVPGTCSRRRAGRI
jgi:hypothetical protein